MTYENSSGIGPLASHIDRFTKERRYLKGVSAATMQWYKYSLQAFAPVLGVGHQSTTAFKGAVIERIRELQGQGRGNTNVSLNTYLRCLKAFLKWAYEEKIVKEPIKLSWLKEEQKILPTLSPEQVKRIVHWKPVRSADSRLHALVLTAIDTGLRAEELVSLSRSDVDLDSFALRIKGKGNKQRLVPMSIELRKVLYRHVSKHQFPLVFCTQQGCKLSKRNLLRDFKEMCATLGIAGVRCSLHTLRHSFAVNYLRRGGNLEYLRRILGHSSILTTQKYLRSLGVEDLQKVHDGLSLLTNGR